MDQQELHHWFGVPVEQSPRVARSGLAGWLHSRV